MTSVITFYYYSVVSFVVILLCVMYKFNSYNWHKYIHTHTYKHSIFRAGISHSSSIPRALRMSPHRTAVFYTGIIFLWSSQTNFSVDVRPVLWDIIQMGLSYTARPLKEFSQSQPLLAQQIVTGI